MAPGVTALREPTAMNRSPRILLAFLLFVVTGVGGAATATAETPPELPPGLPVYLALGDSVANG